LKSFDVIFAFAVSKHSEKKGKTILLKLQKVAKTLRGAFSSYAKLILKFIGFKDLLILNI